jgi:hypothetical protein
MLLMTGVGKLKGQTSGKRIAILSYQCTDEYIFLYQDARRDQFETNMALT